MTTAEAIAEIDHTERSGLPVLILAIFDNWRRAGRPATLDVAALGEHVRKTHGEAFEQILREIAAVARERGWIKPPQPYVHFTWSGFGGTTSTTSGWNV